MRFHLFPIMVFSLLVTAGAVMAQLPDSDIWIADIELRTDGLHIENPVNVTHRPGYDNQPAFLSDVAAINEPRMTQYGLLFASADSLGATDVFRWDSQSSAIVRLTRTPESEYSPFPFPSSQAGPKTFCAVRVEADSTQRLWQFDIDGSNPRLVMADVDSIGYFAWTDAGHIAAFVLGNEKKREPHTLRVIDVASQRETIVARGIGRSITRIPLSNDVAFTVQNEDGTFRFMCLRPGRTMGEPLIAATGTGQDAAWMGKTMLMSSGTSIFASDPAVTFSPVRGAWRQAADLAGLGISGITRLVVSPDHAKIAFVATTQAQ